jgi:hypothetical protein
MTFASGLEPVELTSADWWRGGKRWVAWVGLRIHQYHAPPQPVVHGS